MIYKVDKYTFDFDQKKVNPVFELFVYDVLDQILDKLTPGKYVMEVMGTDDKFRYLGHHLLRDVSYYKIGGELHRELDKLIDIKEFKIYRNVPNIEADLLAVISLE